MYAYNVISWSQAPPTKPGLYIVTMHDESVMVASVYPDRGNLLVDFNLMYGGSTSLEKAEKHVKLWSPRISWAEISH